MNARSGLSYVAAVDDVAASISTAMPRAGQAQATQPAAIDAKSKEVLGTMGGFLDGL